MIVVDSSAWVELLQKTESPTHRTLRRLLREGSEIVVTEAVVMEVLAGARTSSEERALRRMLLGFPVLSLNGLAGFEAAANLYRTSRQSGEALRGMVDCLIAVPAIRARASVLQSDGDFDKLARHTQLHLEPLDA